jgi:hypothetical protein
VLVLAATASSEQRAAGLDTVGRGLEHLDQVAAPGSMDAWLKACLGQEYFVGAGPLEGLKSVATIEAMYRSAQSGQMEQVRGCEGLEASMAQGVVVH